jgi:hypothetical protein
MAGSEACRVFEDLRKVKLPDHWCLKTGNLLVNVGLASSGFNAGFLGLSELLDVAIHGVLVVRVGSATSLSPIRSSTWLA